MVVWVRITRLLAQKDQLELLERVRVGAHALRHRPCRRCSILTPSVSRAALVLSSRIDWDLNVTRVACDFLGWTRGNGVVSLCKEGQESKYHRVGKGDGEY